MARPHPPICDYEGSEYQAQFWDRAERAYEDRAEAVALRRLLPPGTGRLLEVGAGAGRNTPRYRGYAPIVLFDYSRTQLEQARQRLGPNPDHLYVVGDVYSPPFAPGAFQAATMIRVIHHLSEPRRSLGELHTLLAPGGLFILEYPNKRNLKAILRWLLRRQDWSPFSTEPVEFARLNFDFHPKAMRAWLDEAGFDVRRQLTVSHFRLGLLKRAIPLRLLVAMDALAQTTGDWVQLSPSVFVQSVRVGGGPTSEALWRCPVCGSLDLGPEGPGLRCRRCQRLWGAQDGIFDFKDPLEGGSREEA